MKSASALISLFVGSSIFCAAPALASETTTYTYDARGRVVSVTKSGGPSTGVQATYAYDDAGNRTNVTVTNAPNGNGGNPNGGGAVRLRVVFNGRFYVQYISN